jgi:hypothetical protein
MIFFSFFGLLTRLDADIKFLLIILFYFHENIILLQIG